MADDPREPLGRIVRETWVAWALEQPDPKPSWLVPWDDLGNGDREVDMRIGEAVAAAERERVTHLALAVRQSCACESCKNFIADLITKEPRDG